MPSAAKRQVNESIFDDLDDLNESNARLSRNSLPASSTRRNFYDNTYGLFATWERDDAWYRESISLSNAFEQQYLADCEQFTITEGSAAQATFEDKLRQLSCKARAGYNLLVLFYAGGSDLVDGRFVLKSSGPSEKSSIVEWDPILEILSGEPLDVLLVLDCAYWDHGQTKLTTGCMEVLAASDNMKSAGPAPDQSFTRNLENIIRAFKGASISISSIIDCLKASGLIVQPIHRIVSDHVTSKIRIALPAGKGPLPHGRAAYSERVRLLKLKVHADETLSNPAQSRSAIDRWIDSIGAPVSRSTVKGESGEEYEIRAPESVAIDPEYWRRIVQSRPANVDHAELELSQPFESPSQQLGSTDSIVNTLVENLRLNEAIQRVLPNKYTRVCLVPLMWEEIEKNCEQESDLEDIRAVFRDEFNYEVDEIYRIKSNSNALTALKAHINQKMAICRGTDMLLITVYGGHGVNIKKREGAQPSMIIKDRAKGRFELNWSRIQSDLLESQCDTLAIMNCCYGGNTALGEINGTNEILSAVDRDTETYTQKNSFLRVLRDELKSAKQEGGINVETLHHRVDLHNRPGENLIRTPFRARYPLSKPSIWLRPLLLSQNQSTNSIEADDKSFFVRFFLRNPEDVELKHYNDFFQNWDVPQTVKAIRFYKKDEIQMVSQT